VTEGIFFSDDGGWWDVNVEPIYLHEDSSMIVGPNIAVADLMLLSSCLACPAYLGLRSFTHENRTPSLQGVIAMSLKQLSGSSTLWQYAPSCSSLAHPGGSESSFVSWYRPTALEEALYTKRGFSVKACGNQARCAAKVLLDVPVQLEMAQGQTRVGRVCASAQYGH